MSDLGRTATTYRCKRWRALAGGILEAAATIFLLLGIGWLSVGLIVIPSSFLIPEIKSRIKEMMVID